MINFVDIPMQLHYDGVRWLILGDDNGICGCPCAGAWLVVLIVVEIIVNVMKRSTMIMCLCLR